MAGVFRNLGTHNRLSKYPQQLQLSPPQKLWTIKKMSVKSVRYGDSLSNPWEGKKSKNLR